jgi:hypothetical protein
VAGELVWATLICADLEERLQVAPLDRCWRAVDHFGGPRELLELALALGQRIEETAQDRRNRRRLAVLA